MTAVTINIDGEDQEIDIAEILTIKNPEAERDEVTALMAWWGSVWASAAQDATLSDVGYRHWKGISIKNLLEADPKTAEWKMAAMIESTPEWKQLKMACAAAERNAGVAKAIFEAYARKADLLARLVRRDDNERYHAPETARDTSEDPRVQKMAAMNNAKAKKTPNHNTRK